MNIFIGAKDGPKNSVLYTDSNGKSFIYSQGTRTWRNNNPGNLVSGKISKRNNQIGVAGGFAVFPDYKTGHNALIDCLKTTYINSSITDLVKAYAPKGENNVPRYTKFLLLQTGVLDNKIVKNFTSIEFEKLWKAIEKMEGWKEGEIKPIDLGQTIIKVKKNKKGVITSYLIKDRGWMQKNVAIKFAKNNQIDAVVVRSTLGTFYLRSRPDKKRNNNFDCLV